MDAIGTPIKKLPPILPGMNRQGRVRDSNTVTESRGLPLLGHLPRPVKGHIVAMIGEFVGTFLFLFCAFGGMQVVNDGPRQGRRNTLPPDPAKLLYIALVFGFSLAVNV